MHPNQPTPSSIRPSIPTAPRLDFWVEGDTPPSLAAAAADPAAPPSAVLLAACLECLACLELEGATNYLPLQVRGRVWVTLIHTRRVSCCVAVRLGRALCQ